jgi:hypothetical protein
MVSKKLRGNHFEYFIPNIAGVKPQPIPSSYTTTGKPKFTKPAAFIKANYVKTTAVPFGKKGNILSLYPAVPTRYIVRAALECGYGRRGMWTSHLVLNPSQAQQLAEYLLKRLLMVAACIGVNGAEAYIPRSFYFRIEASEKVAISFIVGGIGTYLAAENWLNAAGDKARVFLHSSIYSKGVLPRIYGASLKTSSSKSPDYIVETNSGDWYVFESKGGNYASRYKRIVEGLLQLNGITSVGWSCSGPKTVTASMCVHTSLDSGKPMKVTAIDPPGVEISESKQEPIILNKAVCLLLKKIEALDQFHALNVLGNAKSDNNFAGWTSVNIEQIPGLIAAIPEGYLMLEGVLRPKLGVYFLFIEILERQLKLRKKFYPEKILDSVIMIAPQDVLNEDQVRSLLNVATEKNISPTGFLLACCKVLELENLLSKFDEIDHELRLIATQHSSYIFTTGGIMLHENEE